MVQFFCKLVCFKVKTLRKHFDKQTQFDRQNNFCTVCKKENMNAPTKKIYLKIKKWLFFLLLLSENRDDT
jgi:hypothetical protein